MSRWLIRIFCLSFCTLEFPISAGTCRAADAAFAIEQSAVIVSQPGGALVAAFDFGELPAGKQGLLKMTIENPFEDEFVFVAVEKGCSCLKLDVKGDRIPAHGKLVVEAELSTPTQLRELQQRIGFFLKESEGVGISTRLEYSVAGALSFVEQVHVTTSVLGAKRHKFWVPLLLSLPISPEGLVFKGDGGLEGLTAKLAERSGATVVECEIDLAGMREDGRTGNLHVTDSSTKLSTKVLCMIEAPSLVVVAPSVVRLRPETDLANNPSNRYSASLIVRVEPDMLSDDREEPLISFRSEVGQLRATPRRIAPGIYRVALTLQSGGQKDAHDEQPDFGDNKISWEVKSKKFHRTGTLQLSM